MRSPIQILLVGLVCLAAAAGGVVWLASMGPEGASKVARSSPAEAPPPDRPEAPAPGPAASAPEPARKPGIFLTTQGFEDGGVGLANEFTGTIHDPSDLGAIRQALLNRPKLARGVMEAEVDRLHVGPRAPAGEIAYALAVRRNLGLLAMYEGRFDDATGVFEKDLALARSSPALPTAARLDLMALLGIVAMRRGEVANCIECVGPSSCIFPISPEAAHTVPAGSREAILRFTGYLDEAPGDLRVRWLLNLAYMTLGEYPAKVPPKYLISLEPFASAADVGRFENVASAAGLTLRGPNQAGGSIFDDFNGDGRPDLFTTSLDVDRGASLFLNRGDGTFEDHSDKAGITDQVYVLNLTRADYDNDGDLDLLLLRGAWEKPLRMSLLRNKGDGSFEDVTIPSGLGLPISSESAAWGDYDDDGLLDVFVCGEFLPPSGIPGKSDGDPRNRCRLYHNRGDGTFEDVAASAGVAAEICSKGSAWGDYDGDGKLDLYVSNIVGPCRLYHNEGGGKFVDKAAELGALGADASFAVWFWDYDNDGKLDLYVNENMYSLAEELASYLGLPVSRTSRPRFYRNLGPQGFADLTREVGLDHGMTPMGCNFADLDNDGDLDLYLGTGGMSFEHLVPNRLFINIDGQKFADATTSSGTGHLQKGHGVSFADFDGDGDLDFFVEAGGAVPGDRSYNLLFKNPGHGRHWLQVKLIGTRTNRSAIGAHLEAVIRSADGRTRSIHRTIGNNSSFGGNSLVESIGLKDDAQVAELRVTWPTSKTSQTFRNLNADQAIEITEGADTFRAVGKGR